MMEYEYTDDMAYDGSAKNVKALQLPSRVKLPTHKSDLCLLSPTEKL